MNSVNSKQYRRFKTSFISRFWLFEKNAKNSRCFQTIVFIRLGSQLIAPYIEQKNQAKSGLTRLREDHRNSFSSMIEAVFGVAHLGFFRFNLLSETWAGNVFLIEIM